MVAQAMRPTKLNSPGAVLTALRRGGARTISELATEFGLSRSTVIGRLNGLIATGLVVSRDGPTGLRGRPASVYEFVPQVAVLLVAQVGMSGCRLAVTDLSGSVLGVGYVEVDLAGGATLLATQLAQQFDAILLASGAGASRLAVGIGLGMPGTIETLDYARSLGGVLPEWSQETFRGVLEDHFGAPVFIDRDVNLLGLAEKRTSWSEAETLVCVKLGTLIDSAIIVNDVAILGADLAAGSLGHVKVMGSSDPCPCGGVGCLDAVASGSALVRQLSLRGLPVSHVTDVIILANNGDPDVLHAIREAGRRIGEALATVVNLLNPRVIAFWGYLTAVESMLFAGIRQGLYENSLPVASSRLDLVVTALGDAAGTRGAAMLVMDLVLDDAYIDAVVATKSWPMSSDTTVRVTH